MDRAPAPARRLVPRFAECERCGEYRHDALRNVSGDVLCQNCSNVHRERGQCLKCQRANVSVEGDHVAGRKHHWYTIPLCLNCHAVKTHRQLSVWHPSWRGDVPRPGLFLVQGWLDLLLLPSGVSPEPEYCSAMEGLPWLAVLAIMVFIIMICLPELFRRTADTIAEELSLSESDWDDIVLPGMEP